MKRLALVLLVVLPLTVTARDFNFGLHWNPYPYPEATIAAHCYVNDNPPTVVGNISAEFNELYFTMPAGFGDTASCFITAELGGEVSEPSGVASVTIPFPQLPTPEVQTMGPVAR